MTVVAVDIETVGNSAYHGSGTIGSRVRKEFVVLSSLACSIGRGPSELETIQLSMCMYVNWASFRNSTTKQIFCVQVSQMCQSINGSIDIFGPLAFAGLPCGAIVIAPQGRPATP